MTDEEMIECPEDHRQLERLRAIMHRLRAPGGCPWDAEQTHQSIISNLVEETYETVAALENEDDENFCEELGDLLLQVVFHSEIAEGEGRFHLDQVARGISEKLIRRHPHVFSSSRAEDTEAVLTQWDDIKRQEKGDEERPYLHGVGTGLPALIRATKLQKKAGKVGFDWPDAISILPKIHEELSELEEELASHQVGQPASPALAAELGDLLFVVANLARKLDLDPELALEGTNRKFSTRFAHLEKSLSTKGISLADASLEDMNHYWNEAKSL